MINPHPSPLPQGEGIRQGGSETLPYEGRVAVEEIRQDVSCPYDKTMGRLGRFSYGKNKV
jgi:hypothetical protein